MLCKTRKYRSEREREREKNSAIIEEGDKILLHKRNGTGGKLPEELFRASGISEPTMRIEHLLICEKRFSCSRVAEREHEWFGGGLFSSSLTNGHHLQNPNLPKCCFSFTSGNIHRLVPVDGERSEKLVTAPLRRAVSVCQSQGQNT